MKNYSFTVPPLRVTNTGFKTVGISVNVQGSLPPAIWPFITAHGINLTKEDNKVASNLSGGHTGLRTLINT